MKLQFYMEFDFIKWYADKYVEMWFNILYEVVS